MVWIIQIKPEAARRGLLRAEILPGSMGLEVDLHLSVGEHRQILGALLAKLPARLEVMLP